MDKGIRFRFATCAGAHNGTLAHSAGRAASLAGLSDKVGVELQNGEQAINSGAGGMASDDAKRTFREIERAVVTAAGFDHRAAVDNYKASDSESQMFLFYGAVHGDLQRGGGIGSVNASTAAGTACLPVPLFCDTLLLCFRLSEPLRKGSAYVPCSTHESD